MMYQNISESSLMVKVGNQDIEIQPNQVLMVPEYVPIAANPNLRKGVPSRLNFKALGLLLRAITIDEMEIY